MDWIVSPQNPYVETLTPNVVVFGDRAFKEVIKVKWDLKGRGANPAGLPIREERDTRDAYT